MANSDLQSDRLLADISLHEGYKVLGGVVLYQKLGQGGMGAVYRGRHLRLDVDVAVKLMAPPSGIGPGQLETFVGRFLREARTAAAVRHQNLIRVYDVDQDEGVYFLVMDYVDGESAGDRLARKGGRNGLAEREVAEIIYGAAAGLGEAHAQSIVHRDVKPDNILIGKRGRVVVADLGIAKAFGPEKHDSSLDVTLSHSFQVVGTPKYMSPEHTMSSKSVGPPSDVWSLGATAFALLTGKAPFLDTDVTELIIKIRNDPLPDVRQVKGAEVSDGLREIVEKSLAKDPQDRFRDCKEMARALRAYLGPDVDPEDGTLADDLAGTTKMALVEMATPPASTLTLIARSLQRPSSSERMKTDTLGGETHAGSPTHDTARHAPIQRSRSLVGIVAALLILAAVGTAAAIGLRGSATRRSDAETASGLEQKAEALLQRAQAAVADGKLADARAMITDAGNAFDATPAGLKLAGLAETVRLKLEAEADRVAQERERKDRERRARLSALLADAELAEKRSAYAEAKRLLTESLELDDAASTRERIAKLETAVALEEFVARVTSAVGERKWREAWKLIDSATGAHATDESVVNARAAVVAALAPQESLTGPLAAELVFVEGGVFTMGSATGAAHERPAHQVAVSSFYIGRHETTINQFQAFRSRSARAASIAGGNLPVASVPWQEALDFCAYLTERDASGATYRLPTEAEWEYVARGATDRAYPWGDDAPGDARANLSGDSDGHAQSAPAGSHPTGATPRGVLNLAGNVAEWCGDWIGRYPSAMQTNPAGPETGTMRVVRGGSFAQGEASARCIARSGRKPAEGAYLIGFRVVRELTDEERAFERLKERE